MIRNDSLPSVKAVITADLDLRDLYRNQVLTGVEDFRAQCKVEPWDGEEAEVIIGEIIKVRERLIYAARRFARQILTNHTYDSLLSSRYAHHAQAMDGWIERIPKEDVREALGIVAEENKKAG